MKGKCSASLYASCAVAALLSACGGSDSPVPALTPAAGPAPAPESKPTAGTACDELAGMSIPMSAIALPTSGGTVTTAVLTAPSGTGAAALPEYCLVTGTIAPVDPTAPNIT